MEMPVVPCREVQLRDPADWDQLTCDFKGASELLMAQAWIRDDWPPERRGRVKIGWSGSRLLVLASLSDPDVTTRATRRNERLWELGDVFEMFCGVSGAPGYFEYHVAPNGCILQLWFPDADAAGRASGKPGVLEALMIQDDASTLATQIVSGGWQVFGAIPAAALGSQVPSLRGCEWDVSFCRYDYGLDDRPPILSSTSALSQPRFHTRGEWGRLRFV